MRWNDAIRERIRNTVADAERMGRGEIAVAVAKSSSDYAVYEWPAAVFSGLLWSMILLTFQGPLCAWIENHWWVDPARPFAMLLIFSTFLVMAIAYAKTNLPFVDRRIVPRKFMAARVHERALRQFMESGVANTRERTGILIFVSLLERRVELIADRGISEKIAQSEWDGIVARLVESIRKHRPDEGLCRAIAECGDLLATHFPATDDNPDELTDQPVLPGDRS
jgi:putative membrane protein